MTRLQTQIPPSALGRAPRGPGGSREESRPGEHTARFHSALMVLGPPSCDVHLKPQISPLGALLALTEAPRVEGREPGLRAEREAPARVCSARLCLWPQLTLQMGVLPQAVSAAPRASWRLSLVSLFKRPPRTDWTGCSPGEEGVSPGVHGHAPSRHTFHTVAVSSVLLSPRRTLNEGSVHRNTPQASVGIAQFMDVWGPEAHGLLGLFPPGDPHGAQRSVLAVTSQSGPLSRRTKCDFNQ